MTISGDGNVVGSSRALADTTSGNSVGSLSHPIPFYGSPSAQTPQLRLHPKLNDAGSLYYFALPNFFEIVDVQHALLRMRFALSETVLDTATALSVIVPSLNSGTYDLTLTRGNGEVYTLDSGVQVP